MGVLHSSTAFPLRALFEAWSSQFFLGVVERSLENGTAIGSWSRRDFLENLSDTSQAEETGHVVVAPIKIFQIFDTFVAARIDTALVLLFGIAFAGPARDAESNSTNIVRARRAAQLLTAARDGQCTRTSVLPYIISFYSMCFRLRVVNRELQAGEAEAVLNDLWAHVPFKAKSSGTVDCKSLTDALAVHQWQHELIQRCRLTHDAFELKRSSAADLTIDPEWHVDEIVEAELQYGLKCSLMATFHPSPDAGDAGTGTPTQRRVKRYKGHSEAEYAALFKIWKQKKRMELLTSRNVLSELVSRTGLDMGHVMDLKARFLGMADIRGELSFPAFQMIMVEIFPTFQGDSSMQRLFQSFDADGNGAVDFKEFIAGVGRMTNGSMESKLRLMFELFDHRSTGALTLQDLLHFVSTSTDEMLELFALAHNVVGEMRTAVPGAISEQEFASEMANSPALMSCLQYALHLPVSLDERIQAIKQHTLAMGNSEDRAFLQCVVSNLSARIGITFMEVLRTWDKYNANQHAMSEDGALFSQAMVKQTRDRVLRVKQDDEKHWSKLGSGTASADEFAALPELIARGRSSIWLQNGNELVQTTLDLPEFCSFMLMTFRLAAEHIPSIAQLFNELVAHQAREEVSVREALFTLLASCAGTNTERATAVFRNGDILGKGRLRVEEVINLLLASQSAMSGGLGATFALIRALDVNGDGQLSWEEFRDGITNSPELLQCFGSLLGTSSSTTSHMTIARMQAASALKAPPTDAPEGPAAKAERPATAPSRIRLLRTESTSMLSAVYSSRLSSPDNSLRLTHPQRPSPPSIDTGARKSTVGALPPTRRGAPKESHTSIRLDSLGTEASFSLGGFGTPMRLRLDSAGSDATFGGIALFSPSLPPTRQRRVTAIADARPVYAGRRVAYEGKGHAIQHKLKHRQRDLQALQDTARREVFSILSESDPLDAVSSSVAKLRAKVNREQGVRLRREAVMTTTVTSSASGSVTASSRPSSARLGSSRAHVGAVLKLRRPQTAHIVTRRMQRILDAQAHKAIN